MAGVIECTVRADAFCHSMVRSLVGALVAVATGQRDHEWLAAITERGVRDPTITVMPAAGLTLEEVGYPADHELADARPRGARPPGAEPIMTSREPSQYFSEQPGGTEVRRTITARIWGRELTLITAGGVFAADGLDRGTAVLLRASPIPAGDPADPGPRLRVWTIALAVAVHCPGALVDAVDVNERALALCRDNARGARCGGPGTSAAAGRGRSGDALRRDLVQPSDPNRQAGSA